MRCVDRICRLHLHQVTGREPALESESPEKGENGAQEGRSWAAGPEAEAIGHDRGESGHFEDAIDPNQARIRIS